MSKLKVLELFAGTRSIGKAFEQKGHEVFSVEWNKGFENIDLYADINTITAEDILNAPIMEYDTDSAKSAKAYFSNPAPLYISMASFSSFTWQR